MMGSSFVPMLRRQWPIMSLLGLALFTHAPVLHVLAWPALLFAILTRRLSAGKGAAALRIGLLLSIYCLAATAWGWFSSDTLRLTLLTVLLLKWAESRSRAESAMVVSGLLVAIAIGSLNWNLAWALCWITLSMVLALHAAGDMEGERARGRQFTKAGKAAMMIPLRHFLLAMPMAGVLFVFFPRIPGPLWDIGLSFGLPLTVSVDQSPQGLGVAASLKPGQTQSGADMASATPVLVAEFEQWVPPTSTLYWRGPVFYDYDGDVWKLNSDISTNGRRYMSQGWRSVRTFVAEQLAHKGQEVRYTIRLSPHKATWLYSLDLPAALPTEAWVGPDWQVISHRPVEQEMTYPMISWLEWQARPELSADLRKRALALPAEGNARLRALGQRLQREGSSDAIIRAALAIIVQGQYQVRDVFDAPQGRDAFDRFWFETRTGNAEFFAGSLVYLMRAAGIPARLVTGYHGGKLMALTNYVVVKRSHAHAWVELWDTSLGWRRIDPVDILALRKRVENAPQAHERNAASQPTAPARTSRPSDRRPAASGGFAERSTIARLRFEPSEKTTSALDIISTWINHWVVRLDADRQLEMLAGKGGGFAWVWLLLGAIFLTGTIALGGMGFARWRDARRLPTAERAWQRVMSELARHGLARQPSECPQSYARRIGQARPELATGVQRLVDAYCGWRYGNHPERWPMAVGQAARYLLNLIAAYPTMPKKKTLRENAVP